MQLPVFPLIIITFSIFSLSIQPAFASAVHFSGLSPDLMFLAYIFSELAYPSIEIENIRGTALFAKTSSLHRLPAATRLAPTWASDFQ